MHPAQKTKKAQILTIKLSICLYYVLSTQKDCLIVMIVLLFRQHMFWFTKKIYHFQVYLVFIQVHSLTFYMLGNFACFLLLSDFFSLVKGSLTVWALYAYFSDSQDAAYGLLVWCM